MGSAAATPVRATTPDAVVVPLQYAVAEKGSWLPGSGGLPCAIDCQSALRESNISASYMRTKPTTAITRTTSFRHVDREMVTRMLNSQAPEDFRCLPKVLVSLRQFSFAVLVLNEQARRLGDNAYPGYRQIAQMSSYRP